MDQIARTVWTALAAAKNAIVSVRVRDRRVWAGPARGAVLHTSYRVGTRALTGLYERELAPYLRRYVTPGAVCYDIGAAGGYYAFAFARLAAPGHVSCFECDTHAARVLEGLATRNGHLGSRITVARACIGAAERDDIHTSLDAIVYRRGGAPPDVIKIDAEGAELDIVQGGMRLLRDVRPRLLIEVHSSELEHACAALLEGLGYRTLTVDNRGWMAEHLFRAGHNRWLCAE